MVTNSKLTVILEVDVTGVESNAEARETAMEIVRPLLAPSKKRGPKTSGPRAVVTGFRVEDITVKTWQQTPIDRNTEVDETVDSNTVRG